jgi:hypothetical protein
MLRRNVMRRRETMDMKTAVVLGVCVIVAALIATRVPRPICTAPAPPGAEIGRFQMSGVPGHAYVIDTVTGQVWEKFASTGSGQSDGGFKSSKVD